MTARRCLRDVAGLLVALSGAITPGQTRADRIILRGGGEIQGVIVPPDPADGKDEGDVQVLTTSSSRPYEFRKVQILKVERVDDALRQYLERRDKPRETAEDEYQFGLWCEKNGVTGPAQIHFKRAVELDDTHAEANKKVGRVYHNGRWMTYDEQRQAMGLVKHEGKWVSGHEMEEITSREKFSADQSSWARRLKVLRQKWLSGTPDLQQEAEAQLSAIREPSAVAPLVSIFGADPEPVRVRLAGFIAAIEGPESISALIRLILAEPNLDVRQAMLQQLQTRHDVETIPKLTQALGSKDLVVVGRAAWALGMLDAVAAVPKLVPVLVKVDKRMVFDQPEPQGGMGNLSFTSIGAGPFVPGGAAGYAVPGASGTTGPIYPGNGSSLPVLTGPVVGPGVVAFGATSVPFGTGVGLSTGANPNRPSARIATRVFQNEEVLLALKKLTGQDFGYDVDSWRRWLRVGYRAEPAPERRVPQP